uniref:Uncharacterized protein n=1 Tax=Ditylum brightwellii TaxID=49249 RepID=A0A7S1ZIC5_9STRA
MILNTASFLLLLANHSSAFVKPSIIKHHTTSKKINDSFDAPWKLRRSLNDNDFRRWQRDASSLRMSSMGVPERKKLKLLRDRFLEDQTEEMPALEKKPVIPDCVVGPDYKLAFTFGVIGALIIAAIPASILAITAGGLILLFSSFLAVQTARVRFVFDETSFELKTVERRSREILVESGENVIVGGANRWAYDTFVEWKFIPTQFPILVYFKETQTSEKLGNKDSLSFDDRGGTQGHFFPAICNTKQLEEQFEIRGCAKLSKDNTAGK